MSSSTSSPGSRCPVERTPGSKRVRRSWPGSPANPGEPPGGSPRESPPHQETRPSCARPPRPRRPPLVGDGADKPSFGAFPRLSARSYRECHQLNGPNREKISVNRAPRPAPAHRAPAQRGVR